MHARNDDDDRDVSYSGHQRLAVKQVRDIHLQTSLSSVFFSFNNNSNEVVLWPFCRTTGLSHTTTISCSGFHVAPRGTAHSPTLCRSCPQVYSLACQQKILQKQHTESEQINGDRRDFMP